VQCQVQYGRVQYGRVQYGRVQYGRVQYGRVQYGRVQYGTVLHVRHSPHLAGASVSLSPSLSLPLPLPKLSLKYNCMSAGAAAGTGCGPVSPVGTGRDDCGAGMRVGGIKCAWVDTRRFTPSYHAYHTDSLHYPALQRCIKVQRSLSLTATLHSV
jgi:hypothetical protein